ncbi:hypothetical protein [Bacillus tropicus]|uniref:hypothetical protein n=1 Tax=Bacillus tropicus TaxID=2026188 RepID=UPI003D1CEBAF
MKTYPIINIAVGKYKIRLRYATGAFVWFHIIDLKAIIYYYHRQQDIHHMRIKEAMHPN